MQRRTPWIAAALVGAGALTLAACSSGTTGSGNAASSGTTKANAVLTVGETSAITQLDPNTSGLAAEDVTFSLLWNGLTKYAANGSVVPDLATSWSSSSNGLTWTFHLRSGIKYFNGQTFTATDAVQNINRVLDPANASQWRTNISMITKAVATNATTLTLTLSSANAQLPTSLIPVKMTYVPDIANVNKDPDGTGPYMLKSFVPNQSVDLVANPHYWGGKPSLSQIRILNYPDVTAAETALKNGTLDALWGPPQTAVPSLKAAGLQIVQSPDPGGLNVFEVDNQAAPFNNPAARQALAYATDRVAMVKAGLDNYGLVNATQTPVSTNNPFHDKSLTNYGYNLAKAKQLFAQAGVTSGSTLTYWTLAGNTMMAIEGQVLQQSLAQIGIKLVIQSSEVSTWAAEFYPYGKTYPAMIVSNDLSFQPAPQTFSSQWFSSTGTCECNWHAPASYNAAVAGLEAAKTTAAQAKDLDLIQQTLNQQSPIVVVADSSSVTVAQPSVKGLWEAADGTLHLEDATITG
jgi:peptide/nickel transport system substrate-binding protein